LKEEVGPGPVDRQVADLVAARYNP
jgi:hypothetical protein